MNYLDVNDPNILEDITRRKEFYQYYKPDDIKEKKDENQIPKYNLNDLNEIDINLELQSYQGMVANFIHPMTPYSRLLLKWDPGQGKTLASLSIAMQFIHLFERESQMEDQQVGSIFVLGFTEEIFKKDLLSFPRFGFINRDELKQLELLRDAAQHENKTDIDRLQEFTIKLKKRLSSRKENGYFKFFGYKAFVNRIFMLKDFKRNINDMSEEDIRQSLKDGSLKWNKPLLDSFHHSIILCDEIHNVYNSLEKNNWGVALQMVLDQDPTIKAVFMSATPLNNNPTEIIDLGNLFQPPDKKLKKEDFFDNKILKPGALEKISDVFHGRVSFIQNSDPRNFASQTIEGETIKDIPYLKFKRCPMSEYHYKTYKAVYTGVLAQDAQYLMDIAFPNPQGDIGLYKTTEIKRALSFVSEDWVKKFGFKIQNDVISGTGLYEQNIGKWSTKMYELLKEVKSNLTPFAGKVLIYHDVVHISGVLFIEQLFLHNGLIGIDQTPTDSTLCAICGKQKIQHKIKGGDNKPNIVAPDDDMIKKVKEIFKIDIASCTSRVSIDNDGNPKDVISWTDDNDVTIIDFVSNDNLLEYLPNTVLIKIISENDNDGYYKWSEKYFREYDRYDGNIYMSFNGRPDDGKANGSALVKLQKYSICRLAPKWEEKLRVFYSDPFIPTDVVILLIKDNEIHGVAIFRDNIISKFSSDVDESEAIKLMSNYAFPRNKSGGKEFEHDFMAARYIVAHSDMDKSIMDKHIEKYNLPDNTWGYSCKFIIGSKLIREARNFKAVRKVLATARPANISALLQLFGRARRNKAHLMLPPEYRTIVCIIFTSCLPIKEHGVYMLSHEEIKYKEKMDDYLIIQQIEKCLHENAIDAITARNLILPGLKKDQKELGALWFEPSVKIKKRFNINDLNLNTFKIFHSEGEIHMQMYVIKRLFIEQSLCYTYDQLWIDIRHPPFHIEQDCSLFQEEYFVIALSMLVFGMNDHNVRPIARGVSQKLYLLDILHNKIDKRIMQPDGTIGYIHHISNYYIFVPFRNSQHDIFIESSFRTFDLQINKPINIMRYVKESSTTLNYESQKLKFKNVYENVPLEKLATVTGKFSVIFHQTLIEEIIKYVFNLWTNPINLKKSEMHDFYFKMLYYYDLIGLIVWVSTAKEFIREQYKLYSLPLNTAIPEVVENISKEGNATSVEATRISYESALKQSVDMLKKKNKAIIRADPKLLPIGHFITTIPRFYHPDKDWFDSPEYTQRTQEYKENEIIIGYYEKLSTGLRVKFKIRSPLHKIEKFSDTRMIERGSICSSNTKSYLLEIAEKLKIIIPDKINVPNLCHLIEEKLQLNELEERRNKTNIKWLYPAWEHMEGRHVSSSLISSS